MESGFVYFLLFFYFKMEVNREWIEQQETIPLWIL